MQFTYYTTDWNPGEPDNDHNQDCVLMKSDSHYHFRWDDVPCSYFVVPAICELQYGLKS